MNFMGPYILAMREQAPKMFMELRRSGKLEQFARERALEGNALAEQMLARRPKDAHGQPSMADEREVEEIVLAQMLEFEPEGKAENPEPPDDLPHVPTTPSRARTSP